MDGPMGKVDGPMEKVDGPTEKVDGSEILRSIMFLGIGSNSATQFIFSRLVWFISRIEIGTFPD